MSRRLTAHAGGRTRRPLILCGAVLLLLLVAAPASAVNGRQLASALAKREAKLGARSGALVRDLTTGATLYDRNRGLGLSPASNEKLYTTAAALLKWGPNARLRTEVRAKATVDDRGVLDGNVVLVGAGDPSFGDDDLRNLAADLKADGIKHITGRVYGDEQQFDTRRGSYETDWQPDSELGGWLSALVWGHGRVGTNGPAQYTANRLAYFLRLNKIRVDGKAHTGGTVAGTTRIGWVDSPTIAQISAILLPPSDNFYAEMLAKGIGARFGSGGSTTAGATAIRATLAANFGIHPTIVDGSGLAAANHTSPSQIVSLLTGMAKKKVGVTWRNGFPIPGRTGTLAARMRGTAAVKRCKAKTGTLHDVSALSGYCKVPGGHLIAFSFLENRVDPLYAKALEDQMVPIVARYSPPS
jgi:D-alanyl-D-alanine carboxypeptidase/D-alanyl-D-alanine-endopeptidase (penicillin-binding protein 4)